MVLTIVPCFHFVTVAPNMHNESETTKIVLSGKSDTILGIVYYTSGLHLLPITHHNTTSAHLTREEEGDDKVRKRR